MFSVFKKTFFLPLTFIICFIFITKQVALAVPAAPVVVEITQADGTSFPARQWGDERGHGWETLDGYTIILDETTGNWHYGMLDTGGRIIPSGRVVGKSIIPLGIPKHLRPVRQSRIAKTAVAVPLRADSQKVVPASGTAYLPVILINFADTSTTYTPSEFDTLLFGTGNKSMKDYYDEVSYGNFSLNGSIAGWYTAANNHDYYGTNDAGGDDMWPGDLVYEAVAAADSTVDFSQFDNDGDCYVDVVAIVHQGEGEEAGGGGSPSDIWSHRWSLNGAYYWGYSNYGEYTTDDPCPGGGQIKVNDYIIQPETQWGSQTTIGVFCHEYGHALGLPDLYDRDYSSEGIGDWGLMASGNWNGTSRLGDSPAHMSAWSKYFLGWVGPTIVSGTLLDEPVEPASQQADVYQLLSGSPVAGGEYFLIENRQKSGFDAGLPGSGLAIWHIDEGMAHNDDECYPPSDCSTQHYKVALVQADGQWDLEKNNNNGDTGDIYPGSSVNTVFDDFSSPPSDLWDGSSSDVSVNNIYQSGNTMYADFIIGTTPAVTLSSPNGGEVIPSGGSHTITWTASSSAVSFDLEYSINNGSTWRTIATGVTGTSYAWSVPTVAGNKRKCRVRITAYDSGSNQVGQDTSDDRFMIEVIRITSPNGGETWSRGTTQTITWTTNATKTPITKVVIKYHEVGVTGWNLITVIKGGNPGSYDWAIPASLNTGSYRIKVNLWDANKNRRGADKSDNTFTVIP